MLRRRAFPGQEKGLVMKNCCRFLSSAAALALVGALLAHSTAAVATETPGIAALPPMRVLAQANPEEIKPRPRIRTPQSPADAEAAAQIEARPRIRTAPVAEQEAQPSQQVDAPAPRIRLRTPIAPVEPIADSPAASAPRIRQRIATPPAAEPQAEDQAPRMRIRQDVPPVGGQAEPPTEAAPPIRRRLAIPSADTPDAQAAPPPAQGRRGRVEIRSPATGTPPRVARINDDGASAVPRNFVGKVRPDAVVLTSGTQQQALSKLPVIRRFDLAAITATPSMTLGGTTFDFNPMLQNPGSLVNIAKKLKEMPDLVQLSAEAGDMTATQIKQGVVVMSALRYTLKPGACASTANRNRITQAGIACYTYRDTAARETAFSNPAAAEYVRDPKARAKAIGDARTQNDATMADIQANIAAFRVMLNDPAQRAQMTAVVGADELARLEQLDDTALGGELVNQQEVEIEEIGFMPVWKPIPPDDSLLEAAKATLNARALKIAAADAQLAGATEAKSYQIGDHLFLTGFTLGSKDEWRKGISTTIKWCLIGCKRTYYVEAWAGFHYEFGLRFPMKFSGTYQYDPAGGGSAKLIPAITMFDGSADDYRATGLAESDVYNGKEIVAGFGVNAGFAANLPFYPTIAPPELKLDIDLTDLAQFPFKGGNVTPPNADEPGPEKEEYFRDVDLLNNIANLGFVAVKIHPAVRIGLSSNGLGLELNGQTFDGSTPISLPMDEAQVSSFKVANPIYNIAFTLTPGLEARVSINLAVWGTSLSWPVWLSAAKVELPPGGIDFSCHKGTSCARQFTLAPDGAVSPFKRDLKNWGVDFDTKWLPKCVDAICTTGVKLKRYDTVELGYEMEIDTPSITLADLNPTLLEAQNAAIQYANESVVRKAKKASDTSSAMGILAQGIYTAQCKDSLCVDAVAALAAQMGPRANEIVTYLRNLDPVEVNRTVNKEFAPKFAAEIDASKLRAEMKKAKALQGQVGQTGAKGPKIQRTN